MPTTLADRLAPARRILVAVAIGAVLGAMVVRAGAFVALIGPSVLGVMALIALVRGLIRWPEDDGAQPRIMWWTIVSFAAHALFGLVATNIDRDVWYYLGTDGVGYDAVARAIVEHWQAGLPLPRVGAGKEGFYYMLAALYWLFGAHTAAGLAVNATLAAALVPVMSDLTRRLFGPAAARYVAPLVVVFPGLFLWTSQLMREAGILLLLAVALNCAVRLVERVTAGALVVLTAALLLAFTFRAPVAVIVATGLVAAIAIGHRRIVSGLGIGIAIMLVVAGVMVASGFGYAGYKTVSTSNLEYVDVVRRDLAVSAETGFAPETDVSSTRGALRYLPLGLVSFVLGPFPWQLTSARQLPFLPDMLVWWALLPSLWQGFRAAGHRIGRRRYLMVLPAGGITLFMSLALGNFGVIARERLQVLLLVIPLIALGLAERAAQRQAPTERLADAVSPPVAAVR